MRSAFTMIELIFAIVIIGITVVSLPLVTQTTSKGVENSLAQEAIFAAATQLAQAQTYRWDENSLEPTAPNSASKVIHPNDCNAVTKLRPGHINQSLHRKCLNDLTITPSALGSDGGDLDDIDDTIATDVNLINTSSDVGYKNTYTISTQVAYAAFGDISEASKNMKKISVSVKDASGKLITTLSTYSANIGEIDYLKRAY